VLLNYQLRNLIREAKLGGSQFKASTGKKVSKNLSQKTSQVGWYIPVIPDMQEAEVTSSRFEAGTGEKYETLSERQTKLKRGWAWGHGSNGRELSRKCKTLSLNPSNTKQEKEI
jgi:hypothetical protein